MSNFICEHCGMEIIDTPIGYVTECKHYPLEQKTNTALSDALMKIFGYERVKKKRPPKGDR